MPTDSWNSGGDSRLAYRIIAAVLGVIALAALLGRGGNPGSPLLTFVIIVCGIGALAFLAAGIARSSDDAFGDNVSRYGRRYERSPSARFNSYVVELSSAANSLYRFLLELSRNPRCVNELNDLPGMDAADRSNMDFTVNQRLGFIVYCDVRECFRRLGYDDGDLQGLTGVGYAMIMCLLINRGFDLKRFLDPTQRYQLLKIVGDLKRTTDIEMRISDHEGEFRFNVVFGYANEEPEWVQRFATHMYRWASLVAKEDGRVTAAESATLSAILEMKKAGSGSNVRISGRDGDSHAPKNGSQQAATAPRKRNARFLQEVMQSLDSLVGLSPVKQEVKMLADFIKIQRKRKEAGLREAPISYHCVFTGNPGTGKTTVARILADIYREMGVVKRGHLVETDRSGLIAEYVGQTAVKTNKIIDSALDGVLFIDEAYTLVQGGDHDYGGEAIATLLKRMEDDRDRLVVILAGYSDEMKAFINANPGLQSRFRRYIHFPDYSASELAEIFLLTAEKSQYVCDRDVVASLRQIMERAVAEKDKNFGNGRFVRNLFESSIQRQAARLSTVAPLTAEMLSELTLHDLGFAYED